MGYGNKERRKNVVGPITEFKGIQRRTGPGVPSGASGWQPRLGFRTTSCSPTPDICHWRESSHLPFASLHSCPLGSPGKRRPMSALEKALSRRRSVALAGSLCLLPLTILCLHRRSRFSGSSMEVIRVCILCDHRQSQCPGLG